MITALVIFLFFWTDDFGGRGAQTRLSVQKKKKITRIVPILKSNSTLFFFYGGY